MLTVLGQLVESRMVGTALYTASQSTQLRPGNPEVWETGTAISGFDLSNPRQPGLRSTEWVAGGGNVITATEELLFVAVPSYTQNLQPRPPHPAANRWFSDVHYFDISARTGTLHEEGVRAMRGQIKEKCKMQQAGDVLTGVFEVWNNRATTWIEPFRLAAGQPP